LSEDPVTDLSVLAAAEDRAGHGQEAIDVERIALRQHYASGPTEAIAASHDSLGNYLARHASDFPQALGHHLAAALLFSLTGSEYTRHSLISVARDLAQLPGGTAVPASASELSAAVGEVPGVHLDGLLARTNGGPAAVGDEFNTLLAQARTWADPDTPLPRHLAAWDPVIAGIVAAMGGDDQARAAVEEHLAERAGSADWARLAGVLGAILHGQRSLPDDLDKIDTVITRRALAALGGDGQVPLQLWPAIMFTGLISQMVTAAYGDKAMADRLADPLARMGTDSELGPLAGALRRILDGERAPALARGLDPIPAAVVLTILFHVPPASQP
jgi:hypothetical protein